MNRLKALGVALSVGLFAAACSGSNPSDAELVQAAVAQVSSQTGLTFEVRIDGSGIEILGTEWLSLEDDRSVLVVDGAEPFAVATSLDGDALLGPGVADLDTNGRWLRLSPDEIQEGSESAAARFGSAASLIYRGGLSAMALRAIANPDKTTVIGREVASGRATTNYLIERELDGASLPIEVWISDDGELVQMRFLTEDEFATAVEITLRRVERSELERPTYPSDDQTVSRAELDDEREREQRELERAQREQEEAAASAQAELDEARENPVPGGEVTEEDVKTALARLFSLGGGFEAVYILDEVDQLCYSYFRPLSMGFEADVYCEQMPAPSVTAKVCPAVDAFLDSIVAGESKGRISELASEIPAAFEGTAEAGLATGWLISAPDPEIPATVEMLSAEQRPSSLEISAIDVQELWVPGSPPRVNNTGANISHMQLAVTCDRELPENLFELLNG